MNDVKNSVTVQSWCYRAFKTIPQLIEQLKLAGATGTELCGVHADFNDESKFDSVIGQFKQAGLKIVSIGVEGFGGDEAFEKRCKFVKAAGAKRMAVSFGPDNHLDTIKKIEKYAEKYDIYCGIHNHGGYDWLGSRNILAYIFRNSGKRLGLEMDAAWCMQAGEKPIQMAEQFVDRLYGVHFKDFIFDRSGQGHDVVIGEGNLDLKKLVEIVKTKAPADCISVIEYEADEDNPTPAIAKCVQAIKALA
jgi:sugar phosphate isomerase/epimerase